LIRYGQLQDRCNVPAAILDVPAAILDVPAAILDVPAAILDVPAAILDVPAAILDVPAAITGCSGGYNCWQDDYNATPSAHPSSLWDRIGFSSGPSVAITLIYIKSEIAGDSVPNFSSKKLAPPLPPSFFGN
jgi:hypothetical protein